MRFKHNLMIQRYAVYISSTRKSIFQKLWSMADNQWIKETPKRKILSGGRKKFQLYKQLTIILWYRGLISFLKDSVEFRNY